MTPQMRDVLERLDAHAETDPRLDRYRVPAQPGLLDTVPAGRHLSDDLEHLFTEGGWWPGRFGSPFRDDSDGVGAWLAPWGLTDDAEPEVSWFEFGAVWERDHCLTPVLEERALAAPVMLISSQALWTIVAFPTEAALLEGFALTYETIGFDVESPEHEQVTPAVNPFFVEWLTAPPRTDWQGPHTIHAELLARSTHWPTDHRCWSSEHMPYNSDDTLGEVDPVVASVLLGVDPESVVVD